MTETKRIAVDIRAAAEMLQSSPELCAMMNELVGSPTLIAAQNKVERLRAALESLVIACEADCCSDATERGEGRCDDDEAVAATQAEHGPVMESSLTFGMIRRGRAALMDEER